LPTLVKLEAAIPQPWRNGGGVTRELLAWPAAADWQCRISVADIGSDGPFSPFPDVERWFAVLEGHGVVLRFGARQVALDTDSAPLRFDGAAAPGCTLTDGPTRDLNLMARMNAGSGTMRRALAREEWTSAAPLRAIFATGATRLEIDGAASLEIPAFALAWSDRAAGQCWRLPSSGTSSPATWLLSFEPCARQP
jgi:uncharacterized protein